MLDKVKSWIEKTKKHLELEFGKIQIGRANPSLVEDILVENYWSLQPIKNSASVSVMDSQTLSIKAWDKSMLHKIAKAITEEWMWLNPQTMADWIIIKMPIPTQERRLELVKYAKKLTEEAKVWIRNARQDSLKEIKKAEDDKLLSEDQAKDYGDDLQKIVDEANKLMDLLLKKKEEEIMKI